MSGSTSTPMTTCPDCNLPVVPVVKASRNTTGVKQTCCPNCGAQLGSSHRPTNQSGPIAGRSNF